MTAWKVQLLSLAVATVRASREGEVVARLSDAPEEDDAAPLAQTPPDVSQLAPYFSQNITFLEAENMTQDGGWEARQWGHCGNYFSSTVNNVFMSRRMFLHAPANASTSTVARATITVTEDGEYMVMARYEALYRFETGFKVTVEQDSKTLLSAVYGRRSNPKIWGQKGQGTATFNESGANCAGLLNPECVWQWGSVENMVWEGVNNTVNLKPGTATVTLTVHRDSDADCARTMLGHCQYADRNIDAFMFMPNRTDIDHRWNGPGGDANVLAFDGLFSQAGEVFFKVRRSVVSPGSKNVFAGSLWPDCRHNPTLQASLPSLFLPARARRSEDWMAPLSCGR